ncbi:MAG: hypothetical protein VZR11_03345 [Succinimonas sp.]|nr:hypothetical protein [Succinimonas sp.]
MKNADAKVWFLELFMTLNNGSKLDLNRHSSGGHSPGARNKADLERERKIAGGKSLYHQRKCGELSFPKHQARAAQGAAKKTASGLEGNTQENGESTPPNFKALILMPVTETP